MYLAIANTRDRHNRRETIAVARSRRKLGEQREHINPNTGNPMLFVLTGSPQTEQNRVRGIDRSPGHKVPAGASIGSDVASDK